MKTSQEPEVRSRDAIAQVFVKHLQVPTVYFDAPWPTTRNRVDLLVVDRAGSGDVHIVQVAKDMEDAERILPKMMQVPAQFRWIGYVWEHTRVELSGEAVEVERERFLDLPLFAPTGMGRIGVIQVEIDLCQIGNPPVGSIVVRAERFPGSYYDEVDKFIAKHKADIMFR